MLNFTTILIYFFALFKSPCSSPGAITIRSGYCSLNNLALRFVSQAPCLPTHCPGPVNLLLSEIQLSLLVKSIIYHQNSVHSQSITILGENSILASHTEVVLQDGSGLCVSNITKATQYCVCISTKKSCKRTKRNDSTCNCLCENKGKCLEPKLRMKWEGQLHLIIVRSESNFHSRSSKKLYLKNFNILSRILILLFNFNKTKYNILQFH